MDFEARKPKFITNSAAHIKEYIGAGYSAAFVYILTK
jgi:hypothetical protein